MALGFLFRANGPFPALPESPRVARFLNPQNCHFGRCLSSDFGGLGGRGQSPAPPSAALASSQASGSEGSPPSQTSKCR